MVSVLTFSAVDHGFIGGIMVRVLTFSVVDRGFIGGVMVSVLTFSLVDHGFEPDRVKPKTIKLVFVASFLSTHHLGERARTGWLGIMMIMCPSEVIWLPGDCCFSELAL